MLEITSFGKNKLNRLLSLIFLMLCCFLLLFLFNFDSKYMFLDDNLQNDSKMRISQGANEVDPIYIDGNWSQTAQTFDWCSGTGEINDPYTIKDIRVNGNNSNFCLFINNSHNEFFKIQNCTFYNCSSEFSAIILNDSDNGTFTDINCTDNQGGGIELNNCNNLTFNLIDVQNNQFGIVLKNNCIKNNFTNINLIDNSLFGVNITDSSSINNWLCSNQFINNTVNANDFGSDNYWDNGTIGNYWDDYGGSDLNDDGIGDDPYDIGGSANSADNYPLWDDGDDLNPKLIINSPSNETITDTQPVINVTSYDVNLDKIWYEVGEDFIFIENNTEVLLNLSIWNSLSNEAEFTIDFFANDTSGNVNDSISYTLYKDVKNPRLIVNNPIDGEVYKTRPPINIAVFDMIFEELWYEVNGQQIFIGNNTEVLLDPSIWGALSDETEFVIQFFANDSLGHLNDSISYTLFKDVLSPRLIVNNPIDQSFYTSRPLINVTVYDMNYDALWYEVNGEQIFIENNTEVLLEQSIWDALSSESQFEIYFYVNDSVGNINDSISYTLYKDLLSPRLFVNNPIDGEVYTSRPPINITVFDMKFEALWYEVNGQKIFIENNTEVLLDPSIWGALSDETEFVIQFFANDSLGHLNDSISYILFKDVLSPRLIVNSPIDGETYSSRPLINITVYDMNYDALWYEVNGEQIFIENNTEVLLEQSIWDALSSESQFEIYFYVNDSVGNINDSISYTLYKDLLNPRLIVNSPIDQNFYTSRPLINVTVYDMNFEELWYEVNGQKIFIQNNTEVLLEQSIWDALSSESQFEIYFYVNDSVGNINNTIQYTLYKDLISPRITIHDPKPYETFGNNPPEVNLSVTDPYLEEIWYQLKNNSISTINYTWLGSIDNSVWSQIGNGTVEIIFYSNDSAGNIGFQNVFCYKDLIAPEVQIDSPEDESHHNSPPQIQITVIDPNFDKLWYEYGTYKEFLNNSIPEPLDSEIWNSLPDEGEFTIQIFANDSLGNLNNVYTLTLYKDLIAPKVQVNLPIENQYHNSAPLLNISVFDPYFDEGRLSYHVEGDGRIRYLDNGIEEFLDNEIWDDIDEGVFRIFINAWDKAGNVNDSVFITLFKDTEAPEIVINLPEEDIDKFNSAPTLNIMFFDPNFNLSWYKVFQNDAWIGNEISLLNTTNQLLNQTIWENLAQGQFELHIFANDSFSHLNDNIILRLYKDDIIPEISITSPVDGEAWNDVPVIHSSFQDTNAESFWYRIWQNSSWKSDIIPLENNTDQDLNDSIWNNLSEGKFYIYFYANDSFGNINQISILQIKDTIAPVIIVNTPIEGGSYEDIPYINVTVYDSTLDDIWYEVIGFVDIEYLDNNTAELLNQEYFNWTEINNGIVQIRIRADDSFNEITTMIVNIYKDTEDPEIMFNSPQVNSFHNSPPIINAVFNDLTPDSLWYRIWQNSAWLSDKKLLTNNTDQLLDEDVWNNQLTEGLFRIYLYANDSLGNIEIKIREINKDTINPLINIIDPVNNTIYKISPSIKLNVLDTNFDKVWYIVNGQKFFLENNIEESLDQSIWDNLQREGPFIIEFYANDSAGNLNNSISYVLHKDDNPPRISIISPISNQVFGLEYFNFNVSLDDLNLEDVWYCLYTIEGGESYKIHLDPGEYFGEIDNDLWDSYGNGTIFIRFYANDSVSLVGSSEVKIFKDLIEPDIQINYPEENEIFRLAPDFIINIIEPFLDKTWYRLINATNFNHFSEVIYFEGTMGSINQNVWDNQFDDGEIIIRFYANDSVGHINYSEVKVIKDSQAPDIDIIEPSWGHYPYEAPFYNISISGEDINTTWYYLQAGDLSFRTEDFYFEGTTGYIDQSAWDLFGNEWIRIYFEINDSLGNTGYDFIQIIKDTITPSLIINDPLNDTIHGTRPIINLTVYDEHYTTIWYEINGEVIYISNNSEDLLNSYIWNSLLADEGAFTIYFFARDRAGNLNDSFSYILYKDVLAPRLTINNPIDNEFYSSLPLIDITVVDMNYDSLWYTVNGDIKFLDNSTQVVLDNLFWNNLADESEFEIKFYANDTLGNTFLTEYTLQKDIIAPRLEIYNPINNSIYNVNLEINLSVSDRNFEYIWYSVDSQIVFLDNFTTQNLSISIWNSLEAEEDFIIEFYANDSAGQVNMISYMLSKDIIAPRLTVFSPLNNTSWDEPFSIHALVYDLHLSQLYYSINDSIVFLNNNTETPIDLDIWVRLSEGNYELKVYAIDDLGNITCTIIHFEKEPQQKKFNLLDFLFSSSGLIFPLMSAGIMVPVSFFVTKTRYYKSLSKEEKKKTKHVLVLAAVLLGSIVLFYLF